MPDAAAGEPDSVTWSRMLADVTAEIGNGSAARWLCQTASGCDGDEFTAILGDPVSRREGLHLQRMLRRLADGEPLQYVLGRWGFRRLDVMVDRRVLIPRPETEQVVDVALARLCELRAMSREDGRTGPHRVADLGTGSGAVGLALLDESPPDSLEVWMTDLAEDAIDVARANAAGLGRVAAGARFALGDWFDALDPALRGTFDVIVANPPYIAIDDPDVEHQVRNWEPPAALFSGADGLDAMRVIIPGAQSWLRPGGLLVLEIGHQQGPAVETMMVDSGWREVMIRTDLAGRPRIASGQR